jgi:hypothetical protein
VCPCVLPDVSKAHCALQKNAKHGVARGQGDMVLPSTGWPGKC